MTSSTLARPAALPPEPNSFVDRRPHLRDARALLGETRLLTVFGPGGVGKSRFALRLAETVRTSYRDGVWFFDLSSVLPAGSAADAVATRLGVVGTGRDPEGDVARYFADRRGLMILDCCERAVDSVAALALRILRDCPAMSILTTSQAVLRLSGETVFALGPLDVPDGDDARRSPAVELFLDRSRANAATPTAAGTAEIAEICRRLEGMPLAIELAASRSRVVSARQILERLDAPLDFLTRGDRDLPPRQRTLKSMIAWSYELCTEEEQRLWRRMSVFAEPWDIEAAEAVTGDPPASRAVLDLVQSLLDKSVLERRGSGAPARYTMLDTVRAFGLELSDRAEQREARVAHRNWCLRELEDIESRWVSPEQAAVLARARRELPEIRSALEYSIDSGDRPAAAALLMTGWRVVWEANGRIDEVRRWGERIIALSGPETRELSHLHAVIATIEVAQGDRESSDRHLAEGQAIADRLGDPVAAALVAAARGYAEPDPHDKVVWFTRSLDLQGGTNTISARADVEERLANAYDQLGEVETAAELRASLVARAIRSGNDHDTANMLMNAGVNALARGDVDAATTLLRQSLSLRHGDGRVAYTAMTEEALASAAARGRDFHLAATLLGSAHAVCEAVGAGAALSPLLRHREDAETETRRVLGRAAFASAYRHGESLSIEAGIATALGAPLSASAAARATERSSELSARESQVVALVAQGLTDREIAEKLVISRRTAEGHVARSLAKLGFTSRSQLAAWVESERGSGVAGRETDARE